MGSKHSGTVTVHQTLEKDIWTALWRFLYVCCRDPNCNTYFFLLMLEKMTQFLQVCLSLVAYISCPVPQHHHVSLLHRMVCIHWFLEGLTRLEELQHLDVVGTQILSEPSCSLPLSISAWYLLRAVCASPSAAWIPSSKALQNHPKQSSNVPLLCADHMAISNDWSISHFCVISLMWGHFGSSRIAGSSG